MFHPAIPVGRTWSKLGEHGERGEHKVHGKDGKHRRDPGFLWKVAAELQAELSDDEKQRLFGWMDDQLVPYLYGANMDDKRDGRAPGGPHRGGVDIKMLYTVLDDAQKETLRTILESYRTQMSAVMTKVKDGTLDRAAAKAELEVDGETIICEGEGNGPVNALDNAIRSNFKKVKKYYNFFSDLKLLDYKVRILNTGTEATTRVLIGSTDKTGKSWFTVGVSPNIIEASFKALIDSLDYKLYKEKAPANLNEK